MKVTKSSRLPSRFGRKTWREARHGRGRRPQGSHSGGGMLEVVRIKPMTKWRNQNMGDTSNVDHLPRTDVGNKWS